jgi:hypothetical protein
MVFAFGGRFLSEQLPGNLKLDSDREVRVSKDKHFHLHLKYMLWIENSRKLVKSDRVMFVSRVFWCKLKV